MCGIAGIFRFDREIPDKKILEEMAQAVAHRGPDGEGIAQFPGCGFAHRRLAILDLSDAGIQPMHHNGLSLVYNGEIYNFKELRSELVKQGHVFKSSGDAEVILKAIAERDTDAIRQFNGMFALALYNEQKETLTLARDRFGIKPLYYCEISSGFAFASEIKALLKLPEMRARLDQEGLAEYFTFQNFLSDRTLFLGIKTLMPGFILEINRRSRRLQLTQYWNFKLHEGRDENPAREPTLRESQEWEEQTHFLLKTAVERQLVSDVEVGSYLSGGIDSGLVARFASAKHPEIKSFTCGFDLNNISGLELGFDERPEAETMSSLFKTEHFERIIRSGDLAKALSPVVFHIEEPRVGQSYPNYYAAHLASKFVKVCLSGTGGDELFGGYPWRYFRMQGQRNFQEFQNLYFNQWQRLVPDEATESFFSPLAFRNAKDFARGVFQGVFGGVNQDFGTKPLSAEQEIELSLFFEAKTFLHGLLVVEDKLSMAHGLELRVPFLDHDLVDFAWRLPLSQKLRGGVASFRLDENEPGSKSQKYYSRTNEGKPILRSILSKYVPDSISQREKQGFAGPDGSWFRGESLALVKSRVGSNDSPLFQFLDRKTVHGLVDEHLSGKVNRRLLVWSLLVFEQWCRTFL